MIKGLVIVGIISAIIWGICIAMVGVTAPTKNEEMLKARHRQIELEIRDLDYRIGVAKQDSTSLFYKAFPTKEIASKKKNIERRDELARESQAIKEKLAPTTEREKSGILIGLCLAFSQYIMFGAFGWAIVLAVLRGVFRTIVR